MDGVIIDREACQNSYFLAQFDRKYYGVSNEAPKRKEVIDDIAPYIQREMEKGVPLKSITRHMLGLFKGRPGATA